MKLWSSQHVFGHSWDRVTQALWRKYPNKLNPNVVAVDVIDRRVDEDGNLHSVRVLGANWNMPTVVTAMLGMPDMCYAIEYSVVDPVKKTMTLKSVNYTFSSVTEVVESIKYCENPEDLGSTLMTHDAIINVKGVRFRDYCEGLIVNTFDTNSIKGRQAIEQVIAKISFENIAQSISEEMEELRNGFDTTISKLDTEVGEIASKLNSEFSHLVQKLSYELDHMSISVKTEDGNRSQEKNSLTEAVAQAGLG